MRRLSGAVINYCAAYTEAELLVFISDCKNCAVQNYMRTLAEYCYALCKRNFPLMMSVILRVGIHRSVNLNRKSQAIAQCRRRTTA